MKYTIITEVVIGSPLANSWVFETSMLSTKPSGLDSRNFGSAPVDSEFPLPRDYIAVVMWYTRTKEPIYV